MPDKIIELKKNFEESFQKASTVESLEKVRLNFIGKKGIITDALKGLKDMDIDTRKTFGQQINELKRFIEEIIKTRKIEIEEDVILLAIQGTEKFDCSIPVDTETGTIHPISIVQKEIEDIFKTMGFIIEDGNEIENEFNNFVALNIPENHPARDMQDTYYLENGQVLKTHTSASQNRIMKKYGAPLKVLFPGRCFRNENIDASHDNTFFQVEGMMIGEDVSISNLIYFMKVLLSEVFQRDIKVRLRPGYFPFVEPGFELDINCLICGGKGCSTCKNSGWLELLPCGMIHPRVLEMGGIDSEKYTGFAFGLGLTRLTMMKYGIWDIRILNSGSLKSLKQFVVKS